jgi:hypothetical protein
MSKRWALSIVVVILATGCSVAWAGEPRTHDRFFLRLSAGGGGATTSIEDATGKIEFSGGVGDANFAIGGVVAPNLAIHGTFWGWSMSDPDAELTISGVGTDSGTLNGTVSMSAVGGGLTYYFMPVNLYLSGSVGIGSLHLDSDLSEKDTDSGVAVDFTLGKEWWVGNSWGLGLAGGFSYHSFNDPEISEKWSGPSYVLRFSATLN